MSDPTNARIAVNIVEQAADTLAKFDRLTDGDAGSGAIQSQTVLQLNQRDLASIMTTKIEAGIRERITQLRTQAAAIQTNLTTLLRREADARSAWIQTQVMGEPDPHSANPDNPTRLGGDMEFRRVLNVVRSAGSSPVNLTYSEVEFSPKTKRLSGSASFDANYGPINYTGSIKCEADAPSAYLELLEAIRTSKAEIATLNQRILDTKAALSNIDTIERQAVAAMSRSLANRSEAGKQIVAALDANFDLDKALASLSS